MKKLLFITFLCNIPFLLFASYIPIKLSGYNSDIVLTSGESNSEIFGGGWSLFSDEKISRGGLPQQIRGLFSDVPYIFNDLIRIVRFVCLPSKAMLRLRNSDLFRLFILRIPKGRAVCGYWVRQQPAKQNSH